MDMPALLPEESSRTVRGGLRSVQKSTHIVDDIKFDDVLDAINPMNHIPILSKLTQSSNPLMPITKMAGSALMGGPIGLAISAMDSVVEQVTGNSMLGNTIETIFGDSQESAVSQVEAKAESIASERYKSIANAHKRHFHTWSA